MSDHRPNDEAPHPRRRMRYAGGALVILSIPGYIDDARAWGGWVTGMPEWIWHTLLAGGVAGLLIPAAVDVRDRVVKPWIVERARRRYVMAGDIEDVIFMIDEILGDAPPTYPGYEQALDISTRVREAAREVNKLRRRLRRKGMPPRCAKKPPSLREWRDYLISLEP